MMALGYTSGAGNGTPAVYTGAVPLGGCSGSDRIAVPVLFAHTAVQNPLGNTFRITFRYDDNGEKTWILEDTVGGYSGARYFTNGDHTSAGIVERDAARWNVTDGWLPGFEVYPLEYATVFQRQLSDGTGTGSVTGLLANYKNITSVTYDWIPAGGKTAGSSHLLFGTMRLTPDFNADVSRTTVAYRRLMLPEPNNPSNLIPGQIAKSRHQAFVNAEYRLYQMVEGELA
jgi:hypothetical protein